WRLLRLNFHSSLLRSSSRCSSPLSRLSSSICITNTTTAAPYTLSLHDALPIFCPRFGNDHPRRNSVGCLVSSSFSGYSCFCCWQDRKSTRLNSSHVSISYAVFCLKKKKE